MKNIHFSLINLDKPSGPTSFTISDFVRKKLNLNKTSHMGTLDPKVTGVLPITLGRACKLASIFIHHDKEYVGVIHAHKPQDKEKIQKIINKNFMGNIKQTPPHRSAVKRAERTREIHEFKILEESKDKKDFLFKAIVEGGTYIRKLCSDLGDEIGGAHMVELRRTNAGIFGEEKIYSLEEFEEAVNEYKKGNSEKLDAMIIPAEEAIKKVIPLVYVEKAAITALHNGKPLLASNIVTKEEDLKREDIFALFQEETFIGIYKKIGEKGIFARPLFVYN